MRLGDFFRFVRSSLVHLVMSSVICLDVVKQRVCRFLRMLSVRMSLVSWWVDLRISLAASMKGGFQKINDLFPFGAPSTDTTSKSFPVSLLACSMGFAIVAEESMICGFEW